MSAAPRSARLRLTGAVALAAVVAALGAVLVFDSGSAGAGAGTLAWNGEPLVFEAEGMPGDWVLRGDLRNATSDPVDLAIADVRVLDTEGRPLKSSVRFIAAFGHGLYPPDERDDSQVGDFEKRRLGEIATLSSDTTLPLTLSWRVQPGGSPAASVDLGPGTLALPVPR